MLDPELKSPDTLLRTLTAEEEALLQEDINGLPASVCDRFAELLKGLLATMASSLADNARRRGGCENFEAAVAAGHRYLLTGPACGFVPEVLEAVLYRLHPDLRIAPVARKVREQLDSTVFEESLRPAHVQLQREGEEVWLLPRTNGFEPRPQPREGWVRATAVRFGQRPDDAPGNSSGSQGRT